MGERLDLVDGDQDLAGGRRVPVGELERSHHHAQTIADGRGRKKRERDGWRLFKRIEPIGPFLSMTVGMSFCRSQKIPEPIFLPAIGARCWLQTASMAHQCLHRRTKPQ